MIYVYHYCATASSGRGSSFESSATIDGILRWTHKILTMEQYREVKNVIVEPYDAFRRKDAKITIHTLTLLHEEE